MKNKYLLDIIKPIITPFGSTHLGQFLTAERAYQTIGYEYLSFIGSIIVITVIKEKEQELMDNPRKVKQVIEPKQVVEGAGVLLLRSISPSRANPFDPFLLFDHFAFNDPSEGTNPGFPMHPHRGIETVTYMLTGSVRHRDSLGNSGEIGPGDVQWMTSGRGILHEEMPQLGPQGNIYGFQLWVNLPARLKMSQPRYQEISAGEIPMIQHPGVSVRLVAGRVNGAEGPVHEIAADPIYMEVQLEPGASFQHPVPQGHTAIAYVFEGGGSFGPLSEGKAEHVDAVKLVSFTDGDSLSVKADSDGRLRFMLMAGAPFKEPTMPYGPFVMNTWEEIQQTLEDLRSGNFVQALA
jgi:quercetin 2,3-dioxygenase